MIPFCQWCDNPFTPRAKDQIVCSPRCASKLAKLLPPTLTGKAPRSGKSFRKSHAGGVAEGLAETRKRIMDMMKGRG